MPAPLFSIITINYNQGATLEQTLASVVRQRFTDYEYIVVDGGSTDDSLRIIATHAARITRWISEPDRGIADAMNKGFGLARGRFLLFLHSDDYLLGDDSLAVAAAELDDTHDVFAFDILYGDGGAARRYAARGFTPWLNFKTGIFHQAAWCRRSAFERIGTFDPSFRIVMDYEWFLRAYRAGLSCKRCPVAFSFMRDTGVSAQLEPAALTRRFLEERRVHDKHCRSRALRLAYRWYWKVYPAFRGIRDLDR